MSGRIAIVADSSACLPKDMAESFGIGIVPLGLVIGGEVFADGAHSASEMFARIDASRERPMSTSPAPAEFLEAFESARNAGAAGALCLTLSAKYSGTNAAAVSAVELANQQMGGFPVRVVDTGGLAMTHGFAVLAAARALGEGASAGEAADCAVRVGHSGRLSGALATMQYLAKGGRVPWIVGWVGGVLGIKPVLAFADGDAKSIGRSRTMERACESIVRYVDAHLVAGRALHLAVMECEAPEDSGRLAERLSQRFQPTEMLRTEFTSVMSVHTGPGFVGVAFYQDA